MIKSVSQVQREEAFSLVRLWMRAEKEVNYRLIGNRFSELAPGWRANLFIAIEEHNAFSNDNAFLQFDHQDGGKHIFYIYTNDDPLYCYLDSAAKPRYSSELEKEV